MLFYIYFLYYFTQAYRVLVSNTKVLFPSKLLLLLIPLNVFSIMTGTNYYSMIICQLFFIYLFTIHNNNYIDKFIFTFIVLSINKHNKLILEILLCAVLYNCIVIIKKVIEEINKNYTLTECQREDFIKIINKLSTFILISFTGITTILFLISYHYSKTYYLLLLVVSSILAIHIVQLLRFLDHTNEIMIEQSTSYIMDYFFPTINVIKY